jgi:hypothetical protein
VERGQRIGLLLAAAVVAIVAVIVIGGGGDDDDEDTSSGTTTSGEPTATVRAPKPKPQFETIRIAGGEVQGGERRIRVEKGDIARIAVSADASDEIHLHGYDVYEDVAPGKPARFRVKADIEGVFELEAHDLGHVIIGTLVVEP